MRCSSTGSRGECRSAPGSREPEAGFTLLEILVSFAIAALVLGVLYQAYSTGLRAAVAAERYGYAVLLAQSMLDELTVIRPPAADDTVGIYHRSWSIVDHPDLVPSGSQLRAVPYEATVTIAWREGIHRREVTLSVLRLGLPAP